MSIDRFVVPAWWATTLLLAYKLLSAVLLALSEAVGPFPGLPPSSAFSLVLSLVLIVSSYVFLLYVPWLGVLSTLNLAGLSLVSAVPALADGEYVVWRALSVVTSVALAATVVLLWRGRTPADRHGRPDPRPTPDRPVERTDP